MYVFPLCAYCSHLKSEVVKCRGELVSKDSELHRLQRDVTVKTSQISCLDESLQQLSSLLNSKSDMGTFCFREETVEADTALVFKSAERTYFPAGQKATNIRRLSAVGNVTISIHPGTSDSAAVVVGQGYAQ